MTRCNRWNADWTPEKIAVVREHWGKKTARQIGAMIGKSKNAVSGKATHLGLEKLRSAGVRRVRPSTPSPEPKPTGSHFPGMKAWADAPRTDECQWLDGDPKAREFCRKTTVSGSSYCAEHHKRCWVPPGLQKRAARKVDYRRTG